MFEINLYIETTVKGPGQRDGKWSYVLEYRLSSGRLHTRSECGFEQDSTANRLVLLALKESLSRIRKPSTVVIHTDNTFFESVIRQDWIAEWESGAWKNKKGQDIKNADLWKMVKPHLDAHEIKVTAAKKHTYSILLLAETEMAAVGAGQKTTLKALETA